MAERERYIEVKLGLAIASITAHSQFLDVLGYSRGSFVAQQLTVAHPEKVNRLMLVAASCGGKEGIPRSPQLVKMVIDFANKIVNHIHITPQEVKKLLSMSFGFRMDQTASQLP